MMAWGIRTLETCENPAIIAQHLDNTAHRLPDADNDDNEELLPDNENDENNDKEEDDEDAPQDQGDNLNVNICDTMIAMFQRVLIFWEGAGTALYIDQQITDLDSPHMNICCSPPSAYTIHHVLL